MNDFNKDKKMATMDSKNRMNGRFMTVTDSYFNRSRLTNAVTAHDDFE